MPWKDVSKSGPERGPWDLPPEEAGQPPAPPSDVRSPVRDYDRARAERSKRLGGVRPPRTEGRKPPALGPSLDELLRELKRRLAATSPAPSGRPVFVWRIAGGLVAGVFTGWLASGFYTVGPDEAAATLRLGAVTEVVGPGLHYHWPKPFGGVRAWPAAGMEATGSTRVKTRDGDVMDLGYAVRWRVTDPRRLFDTFASPTGLSHALTAAALRQAAATTSLQDLTQPDRGGTAARATARLQEDLDRIRAGLKVASLEVSSVTPPAGAADAFPALQDAATAARSASDDAGAYRAKVVAAARADAAKALAAAEIARDQEVGEAEGEAARFALIDQAYRKAPAVTRERLYTETMQRVLHSVRKVVVQAPPGASITLPADALRIPAPLPAPGGSGG